MTATAAVYGKRELIGAYQKHVSVGLSIAVIMHIIVIGAVYLAGTMSDVDDAVVLQRITYIDIPQQGTQQRETIPVHITAAARLSAGTPVPVPDFEVSPEQTIASQPEIAGIEAPGQSGTSGGAVVDAPITIPGTDDPDPGDFRPVEKYPVVVRQVVPEYPEMARRVGVEGTVWLKVLVDKEGRVKKTLVLKSDADIFNEPAIAAAMQYVFTPAIMNAGPVAVWATIPFRFKLNR